MLLVLPTPSRWWETPILPTTPGSGGSQRCGTGSLWWRQRPVPGRHELPPVPAIQPEPPCRRPLPGVLRSLLGPPPEGFEGLPGVRTAGPAGHDGCQAVWRLVWGQRAGAIPQGHVPGSMELMASRSQWRQWPRGYQHLAVVAVIQNHHADGAGGAAPRRLRMCLRPRCRQVALYHCPEITPPFPGGPAFPGRQTIVWRDVEGIGAELWRSSFSSPGTWCTSGLEWQGHERVCPGEVWDPCLLLVWLVDAGPPDPHVHKVVWGALPGPAERLELRHADVACRKF